MTIQRDIGPYFKAKPKKPNNPLATIRQQLMVAYDRKGINLKYQGTSCTHLFKPVSKTHFQSLYDNYNLEHRIWASHSDCDIRGKWLPCEYILWLYRQQSSVLHFNVSVFSVFISLFPFFILYYSTHNNKWWSGFPVHRARVLNWEWRRVTENLCS